MSREKVRHKARDRRRWLTADDRRKVIERAAADVFAERGYHGASIDEIARRAGVTAPVLYDHFESKQAIHRRLLERTRDELLATWRQYLSTDDPAEVRIPRAIDAWARYVRDHPYAVRMYFQETTREPQILAFHEQILDQARVALGVIVGQVHGVDVDHEESLSLEMEAEMIRAGLTGLAIWWSDHPEVPREQVVATAVNVMWIGLERVRAGER